MTETKVLDLTKLTEYNTKLKNKIRWFGLKDDYDAIAVKDPNTLYFITDLHKIIRDGKTYGIGFDIHSVSAEPATTLGNKGDFAIEQDPANPDYGVWWYKYDTDKWENLTGARIDVYNQFAKGSSFGGSVTILTTDGADQAKVILEDDIGKDSYFTKYCVDSVKFSEDKTTWFSLNFPTLTANDTFATTSKTQPKIAFVKSTDPEPVGEDGDFYVKYTDTAGVISDPKLYGKISGTWYLLGGGTVTMDSSWSDSSENGLQNQVITKGVKHCYSDGNTDTGVLPSGMKSITSGDSFPTTMNEGDIFLKHRGTGKDYVTTDDVANNLTTTDAGKVLDARQGKILSDRTTEVPLYDTNAITFANSLATYSDYMTYTCECGSHMIVEIATNATIIPNPGQDGSILIGTLKTTRNIATTMATGVVYSRTLGYFVACNVVIGYDKTVTLYYQTYMGVIDGLRFNGTVRIW